MINARWIPPLAFLSGIPGLVYQVVWTREVGLLAGSQVEAVSVVVASFFGGLALGAWLFGVRADRSASPLRLYATLEIASGLAAVASTVPLRALGPEALGLEGLLLLGTCAALLLPVSVLLGGTLPALLRAAASEPDGAAGHAGRIVGANTAGAVVGVALAVAAIPEVGLRASVVWAGSGALLIGSLAVALGRSRREARGAPGEIERGPTWVLVAASLLGVATLGTEVLATRLATLRLGSSLYAWGMVLGLFLGGLALGNLASARRAARGERPDIDLGRLEIAAAAVIAVGMTWLRPDPAAPASGLGAGTLLVVATTVFPAALLMGAAFPLLVRLYVRDARVGASFGTVSAANTAGGVAGALALPFLFLPAFGSLGAALVLAALNASVGLALLASRRHAGSGRRMVAGVAVLSAAAFAVWTPREPVGSPWVLFVEEGRQATAVVTAVRGNRTLLVDGDTEASTVGEARRTELLLAVLPLSLHPEPRSFLELGLGSGITLGTASRFGLERLACVEIARSVILASPLFRPDNTGADPRIIVNADARVFLARQRGRYDVISANTLHPWSVGATGLYSREYFGRIAAALGPRGIAVQWLPTAQIGSESVALILATFFQVFPEGGLWWGANNLIALGSRSPLPVAEPSVIRERVAAAGLEWSQLGLTGPEDLLSRRIAGAAGVRSALAGREPLSDDRPVLEHRAARRRGFKRESEVYALLVRIATSSAENPGAMFWLESLEARERGEIDRADGRERLAADAGFAEARRAQIERISLAAHADFSEGRIGLAERGFRSALELDPRHRDARMGLAGISLRGGDFATGQRELARLVAQDPSDAVAWNELASAHQRLGEFSAAGKAIERALEANPFYLDALANGGLMAAARGDREYARRMLGRLRALGPLGTSPQERALSEALADSN